jgi:hypothetical protein
MASADDVQLPDLQVIQRYSLAVRGATAPRSDVVAALQADLAWLNGGRRRTPVSPSASVGAAAPVEEPVAAASVATRPGVPGAAAKPRPTTMAAARKVATRSRPAKKAPAANASATQTAAKEVAPRKAPVKKASVKKAAATKAPVKKASVKKAPAKKAPAKKKKQAPSKRLARWA